MLTKSFRTSGPQGSEMPKARPAVPSTTMYTVTRLQVTFVFVRLRHLGKIVYPPGNSKKHSSASSREGTHVCPLFLSVCVVLGAPLLCPPTALGEGAAVTYASGTSRFGES